MELSIRITVVLDGEITRELACADSDVETIGLLMSGVTDTTEQEMMS